jgi:hypothetical protein
MVTALVAEITKRSVIIRHSGGTAVEVRRADLADPSDPHGIARDDGDTIVEEMGYTAGTWRWVDGRDGGGHYKAVVMSDADAAARQRRRYGATDQEFGDLNARAVNLEIARTGRRPSGKPLTPEMREWVREYKAGRREFT